MFICPYKHVNNYSEIIFSLVRRKETSSQAVYKAVPATKTSMCSAWQKRGGCQVPGRTEVQKQNVLTGAALCHYLTETVYPVISPALDWLLDICLHRLVSLQQDGWRVSHYFGGLQLWALHKFTAYKIPHRKHWYYCSWLLSRKGIHIS